jgi:hypothetical protein
VNVVAIAQSMKRTAEAAIRLIQWNTKTADGMSIAMGLVKPTF